MTTFVSRSMARATRSLLKGAGAQLAGKARGRDRRVHRNSVDVEDAKAKPWRPFGDGSFRQGQAHREALIQSAEEDYQQGYAETSFAELRAARRMLEALTAELDAIDREAIGRSPGRQAAILIEVRRLEAILEAEDARLRRVDVDVLKAVLQPICFKTGKLFPSIDWIAGCAGCHRNSVMTALRRLKGRGFLNWVRRSVLNWVDGATAPQREQTSNAYFFEHRARMRPRLWHRFQQLLLAKLRRLGCVPDSVDAGPPVANPAGPLGQALASLAAAVEATAPPLPV